MGQGWGRCRCGPGAPAAGGRPVWGAVGVFVRAVGLVHCAVLGDRQPTHTPHSPGNCPGTQVCKAYLMLHVGALTFTIPDHLVPLHVALRARVVAWRALDMDPAGSCQPGAAGRNREFHPASTVGFGLTRWSRGGEGGKESGGRWHLASGGGWPGPGLAVVDPRLPGRQAVSAAPDTATLAPTTTPSHQGPQGTRGQIPPSSRPPTTQHDTVVALSEGRRGPTSLHLH